MQKLNAIPDLSKEFRTVVLDKVKTKRSAKKDPTSAFVVENVKVDAAHVAAYNQAVGLRTTNELPLTYPFVLAFPVMMRVMTQPDFPYSAMGAVHLSNVIEQRRPLQIDETFDLKVHATNLRPHRRGLIVDMITEIVVDGEVVWSQTSSFLGMGTKLSKDAEKDIQDRPESRGTNLDTPELPETAHTALWKVTPADIKQYAEASGDKNPVHTSKIGAKAFGFPSVIAHGMWTTAKMLTLLEGRITSPVRYSVDFAKPVVLPTRIACWAEESNGTWNLQVRSAKKPERLHAVAVLESAY